jgi:chromosome segregation ATPase
LPVPGDVERVQENLVARARQQLADAEREEAADRGALMGLIDRDRQLRYAMEQASATVRTSRDVENLRHARSRLDTLERERQTLMASRREREMAVDQRRDRTRTARLALEELEQRAARLRETVRHTEHQLMMRQRMIADLEGQVVRLLEELPRARAQHGETEARLAELRRELASLDGS